MPSERQNRDITNREDIALVLTDFYTNAFTDPIIGFLFTDIAQADLEEHVELITQFWASILFKEGSYTRNAMQKHVDLNDKVPLKPGHFTRWLYLFEKSLDQHFVGPTTDNMKQRAYMIADSISDSLSRHRGDSPRGVDRLNKV